MRPIAVTFALSLFVAGSTAMLADPIPYTSTSSDGSVAPTVSTITAASTGTVGIYFYGSLASDSDYVEVYDLGTNASAALSTISNDTGWIFATHGTLPTPGTEGATLNVTVGDIILVEILDGNGPDAPANYFNDPTRDFAGSVNPPGQGGPQADTNNHFYVTPFTSSDLAGSFQGGPNDLFVGIEDRPIGVASGPCTTSSDCDYNDEEIVLTNVTTGTPQTPPPPSSTPEPGSIALLGTGILGAAGMVRRRITAS